MLYQSVCHLQAVLRFQDSFIFHETSSFAAGLVVPIPTFQPFTKVAIGFTKSPPEYIHNLFQAIACNLISQSFADGRSIRYPQVRNSVTHHSTVNLFGGVVVPIPTLPEALITNLDCPAVSSPI